MVRYDNLSSAVRKVLRGRTRLESERLTLLRSHYLFKDQSLTAANRGRIVDLDYTMPNNRPTPTIVPPDRPDRPERRGRPDRPLQPKVLPRTPRALAVMSLLFERPMHPYEMQTTMRERGHHNVIRFKGGSIYDTVERLEKLGFIATLQTSREGRRPERTVYTITDAGRDELRIWLQEMLAEPAREYPEYAAALAFILVLEKDEAMKALQRRASQLEAGIAGDEAMVRATLKSGLPRIFVIEGEYALRLQKAELAWTRQTLKELETGQLTWPTMEDFMALGYTVDQWHIENRKRSEGGGASADSTTD